MNTSALLAMGKLCLQGAHPVAQSIDHRDERAGRGGTMTLMALALGSFVIGTSEFASMGIIQLFAGDLGLSIPQATSAITAYAFGVVIGAPLVTLAAARLNRRKLLLWLMVLFLVGNLASAVADSLGALIAVRFISGLPQGAYFGAGAVVAAHVTGPGRAGRAFAIVMTGLTVATIVGSPLATFMGQTLGWRETYGAVAFLAGLAIAAIWHWVPSTAALDGVPVIQELSALRKPAVWGVMLIAAVGVGSIFAVYTFIGPIVTDVARLPAAVIPLALGVFGVGMTVGNLLGGRIADLHPARGIVLGYGSALAVMAVLATYGANPLVLFPGLFGVGGAMMMAIPTIQVRLTRFAPEAPSLVGAMNLAALNAANALGAWSGGLSISAGFGLMSAILAGFGLTFAGLTLFGLTLLSQRRTAGVI
ncbi:MULTISPECIES: MFS transporter [unclassified Novosphingobium]|uniref:MFS transporter n=1 Tax=unclassified Novosphingobium TaxID=2644732 RepID=UPI00182C05ED|nr:MULTISPECIES: MFS transporter [unclassified Novosphingobium]NMN03787.1 DHA1 family inner membrane transport protein [Novosphingobium sp. SG919]NMN86223.1 DHA1 family inner membrane transport protein [Novosphingobium sp. SG916]